MPGATVTAEDCPGGRRVGRVAGVDRRREDGTNEMGAEENVMRAAPGVVTSDNERSFTSMAASVTLGRLTPFVTQMVSPVRAPIDASAPTLTRARGERGTQMRPCSATGRSSTTVL